jgi:acyl carrier protein
VSYEQILEVVRKSLHELTGVPLEEISPDTRREDVELWDSLNQINLIAMLEERLKIRFDIADVESVQGVDDLVKAALARR